MSYTSSTIPAPPKGKDALKAFLEDKTLADELEAACDWVEEMAGVDLFTPLTKEAEDVGERVTLCMQDIYDMMTVPGNTPYLTFNLIRNGVAIMGEFPNYEWGVDEAKMKAQAGKNVKNAREYKKNYISKWTTKDGVKHSKRGTTTYQPGTYNIRLKGIDYSGYQQYPGDITLANLTNVTAGGPDYIGRIWDIKANRIIKSYGLL